MDSIIEIIFLIVLILVLLINIYLRNLVKKMEVSKCNLTGFEVARLISSKYKNEEPHIIKKKGKFLDYYNYQRNVIKLSPDVFDGNNLYSTYTAMNVAYTTSLEGSRIREFHRITNFLVLLSYIFIVIGSFINNTKIINMGFILFVISFLILVLMFYCFKISDSELEELKSILTKEKIIEDFNQEYLKILYLAYLGTMPYNFFNYFR